MYCVRCGDVPGKIHRNLGNCAVIRIKLDENFGRRAKEILENQGYDVSTVFDQNLIGASDRSLIDACQVEDRVLASLDLDFANPLRFKPSRYSGIAVLRLSSRPTVEEIHAGVHHLAKVLRERSIEGKLWIIQSSGVREYQEEGDQ